MGKVLVAKVILNRVEGDSWFGNTIPEVIYKGNGSQFNAISRGCFKRGEYTEEDMQAVKEAYDLEGYDELLYFYNKAISTDKEFVYSMTNREVLQVGNHTFSR